MLGTADIRVAHVGCSTQEFLHILPFRYQSSVGGRPRSGGDRAAAAGIVRQRGGCRLVCEFVVRPPKSRSVAFAELGDEERSLLFL